MAQKPLQLGRAVKWPDSPDKAVLDRVPNPQANTDYLVRFAVPEFTSICPVTGQPDFAHLVIDYVPGQWLLESKSLKLYVASFRNHGAFHEDCTVMIGKRIAGEIKPKWLRIGGYWYPRGGIPIDVFFRPAGCRRAYGFPTMAWRPIAGVVSQEGGRSRPSPARGSHGVADRWTRSVANRRRGGRRPGQEAQFLVERKAAEIGLDSACREGGALRVVDPHIDDHRSSATGDFAGLADKSAIAPLSGIAR